MNNYAILLAAGDGKRLGSKTPKCFITVNNKPLYSYALNTFLSITKFKTIVLVVPHGYKHHVDTTIDKRLIVIEGGKTRNESFELAMDKLLPIAKPNDKVLIHDAARLYVNKSDIEACLASKLDYGTLAYVGKQNSIDYHIGKYNILTPQFVRIKLYTSINKVNSSGKDLISYLGVKPLNNNFILVKDWKRCFKVTVRADLKRVK